MSDKRAPASLCMFDVLRSWHLVVMSLCAGKCTVLPSACPSIPSHALAQVPSGCQRRWQACAAACPACSASMSGAPGWHVSLRLGRSPAPPALQHIRHSSHHLLPPRLCSFHQLAVRGCLAEHVCNGRLQAPSSTLLRLLTAIQPLRSDPVAPVGTRILQHNVRLAEPQPVIVHMRPAGDLLTSLAVPSAMDIASGSLPRSRHLLAAASLRSVILLDLQRPTEPLLVWHHGECLLEFVSQHDGWLRLSTCPEAVT